MTISSEPTSPDASDSACATGTEATAVSCQAIGPGTTVQANRCPSSSPTALEGGVIEGTFGTWCENAIATTYDDVLIPAGAEAELGIQETDMNTTVRMQLQGFASETGYTAILHSEACGASASDAGPEYVQEALTADLPANLVLDFTTGVDGSADATVTVPWLVPDNGSGKSFVIQSADNVVAGCVTIP